MVSNKVQRDFFFKFQPVQMTQASFPEKLSFLLCDIAPVHLLGRDLLSKLKGDLTLEFSEQTEPDLTINLHIEEEEFKQRSPNLICGLPLTLTLEDLDRYNQTSLQIITIYIKP